MRWKVLVAGAAVSTLALALGCRTPPSAEPPPVPAARLPDPPPAGRGRILGFVSWGETYPEPAPGVLVLLHLGPKSSGAMVGETRTDSEGLFAFHGLAPGEYRFLTRIGDDGPLDPEHDEVFVGEGETETAYLYAAKPLPPGTGLLVKGTVRYGDGSPVGEFTFHLLTEMEDYFVAGSNGRFERQLRHAGRYEIQSMTAEGLSLDQGLPEVEFVEGAEVAIVVDRPRDFWLVVTDSVTGEPLPTARAYRYRWTGAPSQGEYPNRGTLEGEPRRADSEGRIPLGTGGDDERWFVVADGHAWTECYEVRRSPSGRRPIQLMPGGRLRISIPGWSLLPDATVLGDLQGWPREWVLPAPDPEGRAVYEGIPAGEWTITARCGTGGEVHGSAAVEVLPGKEVDITLHTVPPATGRPVPFEGTLTVPPSWGLRWTRMALDGMDKANMGLQRTVFLELPSTGGTVRFRTAPVPPGRYSVLVDPQWYSTVTVLPGGGPEALTMPNPATHLVRVVDDATGLPLERARVDWWGDAERQGPLWNESARPTGVPGEYRIRTVEGRVSLFVYAEGYGMLNVGTRQPMGRATRGDDWISIRAGEERTTTVRLPRTGSVHVTFRWTGEPPDWNDVSVRTDRGNQPVGLHALRDGTTRIHGIEPGMRSLSVDCGDHPFRDIAQIPIRVRPGETTEVECTLERTR